MKGTAMLMHTASMIFISGCVSLEKYTVSDVFIQNAAIYSFISISLKVGSHPHISTNFLRMGAISTNPNLLKKDPIRILTKLGIFKFNEVSRISSTDIPTPKNNAKIDPAEDPEISLTSTNSDSRAFNTPINENIPIDAGPRIRYFIFLLNRIEEIGVAISQTPKRTRLRVSVRILCSSDQIRRYHPTWGEV